MKKLYYLRLLGTLIGLATACSPRAYLKQPAPLAAIVAPPMVQSATVLVPPRPTPVAPIYRADGAAAPGRAVPGGLVCPPRAALAASNTPNITNKLLTIKTVSHSPLLSNRRRLSETTGSLPEPKRIGWLLLLLALVVIAFLALVGIVLRLLVKLIVHLTQRKKPAKR